MPADPSIFEDVPVFALLDAEERAVLAQQVEVRHFPKYKTIFRTGDPGGRAFVTQSGLVRVSMTDAVGEEVVVDMAGPGEIFGLSSLLAGASHLTTASAVENTVVIEVDRNDLEILLQRKPLAGLDMLTMIEKQLRTSHELLRIRVARNPNEEYEEKETIGERVADAVARFGGSWKFIISFSIVLATYILINSLLQKPWDPYPFILLNLFLSTLAAIQAPVIMMSQNRQDAKDRLRGELDYRVNLKAETEVAQVMRKLGEIQEQLETFKTEPS
jgi:CRP/FNR family cyclic AMP-dependent transcriptional regulator